VTVVRQTALVTPKLSSNLLKRAIKRAMRIGTSRRFCAINPRGPRWTEISAFKSIPLREKVTVALMAWLKYLPMTVVRLSAA